jgi:hypothetical protein
MGFFVSAPLLLRFNLLHHRVTRRIATVSFIDHALFALIECLARRVSAVPFIDHAFGSGWNRRGDRSHEHEGSKASQKPGTNSDFMCPPISILSFSRRLRVDERMAFRIDVSQLLNMTPASRAWFRRRLCGGNDQSDVAANRAAPPLLCRPSQPPRCRPNDDRLTCGESAHHRFLGDEQDDHNHQRHCHDPVDCRAPEQGPHRADR